MLAYLKKRPLQDGDDELEQALLGLNHPLIDLALAQYGHSIDVLKALFHQGQLPLRVGVLSNQVVGSRYWPPLELFTTDSPWGIGWDDQGNGNPLKEYLISASDEEICALLQNPKLDDELLCGYLNVNGFLWAALEEERKILSINALTRNEMMKTRYNAFNAAWKLAETVSATFEWACILDELYKSWQPNEYLFTSIEQPLKIADRWHPTKADDIQREKANNYDSLDSLSRFQGVRNSLAKFALIHRKADAEALFESEDVAFRAAAYACADLTTEQIIQAHKKMASLPLIPSWRTGICGKTMKKDKR